VAAMSPARCRTGRRCKNPQAHRNHPQTPGASGAGGVFFGRKWMVPPQWPS
jgi:hypothetical protein